MREGENRQRTYTPKDLQGMAVERDDGGRGPLPAGPLAQLAEQRLMADVQAIEMAHGDGSHDFERTIGGGGGKITIDFHPGYTISAMESTQ